MARSPYKAAYINPDKIALARRLRRKMTPTEALLWSSLRANKLGGFHFRRQVVIEGYVADFYCHAGRLLIEVDGGVHEQQHGYDDLRDQVVRANGYRVLRIPAEDVLKHLDRVLERILEVLKTDGC